jgi:hypothetical protein
MPAKGNKCCCHEVPTVPCTTLCVANVAPARWSVTFAGMTGGTCSSFYCTAGNRTWTLITAGACVWNDAINTGFPCVGANRDMTVGLSITGTFIILTISAGATTIAQYAKAITPPINCLDTHTLTLSSTGGQCAGLPATVDIEPAP